MSHARYQTALTRFTARLFAMGCPATQALGYALLVLAGKERLHGAAVAAVAVGLHFFVRCHAHRLAARCCQNVKGCRFATRHPHTFNADSASAATAR
jgi:hypothetical protein